MNHNANVSVLAKLLATENINIVEDASAKTAAFDLRNRTLHLPIWEGVSRDMVDMLVVHETGHSIDTPIEDYPNAIEEISIKVFGEDHNDLHKKAVSGFLNIIEDIRIDKRQKRRYPGSKYNYSKAGIELMERDFFKIQENKKNVSELILIDRLNIYSKVGVRSGVTFTAAENVLVQKAFETERFEEVKELVEEFLRFCQKELEKKLDQPDDLVQINVAEIGDFEEGEPKGEPTITVKVPASNPSETEEDEGEDSESDTESNKGEGEGEDSESDEAENGSGDNETNQTDGEETETGNKTGDGGHGEMNTTASDAPAVIPMSETDDAFQESLMAIANPNGSKITHCWLPTPDLKLIVDDYKVWLNDHRQHGNAKTNTDLNAWKLSEKSTISYMVKEFELKKAAENYAKISTNKTGVINTNKMYSYKYNEDIFRRNTVVPKGKSHGFVMFVDWSSSMAPNLHATIKQLLSLVMFCKQIQVPFDVYLFKNGVNYHGVKLWQDQLGKDCLQLDNGFKLRNVLSSRMSTSELNEAFSYMWLSGSGWSGVDRLHCTPLNSSILAAEGVVNQFRDRTKVEVVNVVFLTDGDSDPSYVSGTGYHYDGKLIVHDEKTKERYVCGNDYNSMTHTLLRVLKGRTGCNLVGFFLLPESGGYTWGGYRRRRVNPGSQIERYVRDNPKKAELTKQFVNEKFIELTEAGYDSYYLVEVSNTTNKPMGELATKGGKINAKAFAKHMKGKVVNRALLRKFIDNVAKNH